MAETTEIATHPCCQEKAVNVVQVMQEAANALCTPGKSPLAVQVNGAKSAVAELIEAAQRAERKLQAYVGVCSGDKELTDAILPTLSKALAAFRASPSIPTE